MRIVFIGAIMGLGLSAFPAAAQDEPSVAERVFVVSVAQKDGSVQTEETTQVPLLPGKACFAWQARIENAPASIEVLEVLQLPAPAGSWGAGDSRISNDLTAAKTYRTLEPVDGWIGARWCLAEGDPLGPHSIMVTAGSWLDETYEFEVVEP